MSRGLAPSLALALGLVACSGDDLRPLPAAGSVAAAEIEPPTTPSTAPQVVPTELAATNDLVARGATLVTTHQCVRCHSIESVAPTTLEYDCVGCHRQIMSGEFPAPPADLAGYQSRIHSLVEVPMLIPGDRFRRSWVAGFLASTHDLRPNLEPTMPRFALPIDDVAAIAAFLAPTAEAVPPALGDAQRGRELASAKGCGTCHRFSGTDALPATPLAVALEADTLARGQRLAPDLAHARSRLRTAALVAWIADPTALKPDTPMPKISMTAQEVLDIAAYLVETPLAEVAAEPIPDRLPLLTRAVSYEEVDERIFHRTCRHCHSDPEQVIGDGGPGYSGGFGFRKRGLDLNSYEGVRSGSIDDGGQRRSLFEPAADGSARIVAHLWARHVETTGKSVEGVRGMPLGLPPVAPEDIQLLETWISQGRKPAKKIDE